MKSVTSTNTPQVPVTPGNHLLRRKRGMAIQKTWDQVGVRLFLIVMSVIFLIPVYWMIATSLKSNPELVKTPPTLVPEAWAWDNFIQAVNTIPFGTYLWNSVCITVLSVVGAVLSNLIAAYGFSCIQWPGRDKVFYLVLATIFIPFPLAIIPQFDLFAWLHWINTYLPLVVPHFFASAFYVFLLRQFLLQTPADMLDAARIDGASEWRIMWQVVVPTARPALAVVAIFTAVGAWNDFLGPLVYLQDDSLQTLSIGLQAFRTTHDVQFNLLMAASFLVILPVVVLFFAFQRFFVRGITMGSIR
jgi:multiple sugar transport system permease protein